VCASYTFSDILSANQGSELCSQADSVAEAGRKKIEEIYGKYDQVCEAVHPS
jgi:kinetochore protein Nuf2